MVLVINSIPKIKLLFAKSLFSLIYRWKFKKHMITKFETCHMGNPVNRLVDFKI